MSDDDVWGSESEGEAGRHFASELDQEWQARQNQFHTLGFRDGVEAGKNSSVQEGFNLGYAEATIAGFNWGVARGLTSSFAALPVSLQEKLVAEIEARGRLETLGSSIHSYSSTDALRSFHRDINKTLEARLPGSDAALGSPNVEEDRIHDLASQEEGPLDSRDELGFVSMAGISRLPEAHSTGVWEKDYVDEIEQLTISGQNAVGVDCRTIEAGCTQEHVEQPGESSGEDNSTLLSSEAHRNIQVTPVVSQELGHCEDDNASSLPSAAGKGELVELEKRVRNELELASVKICDILVASHF